MNAPSAIPQASQTGLNIQESPAIEVHFEPQEEELISSLLNRLGACREDEAPQEAATRLASMALMLANIASGHLRMRADGIVCDPGVDFIIEGSMASAEFVESVIGPVSWVQDRLERNLLYDVVAETPRPKRESHIAELRRLENMEDCIALPVPSMRKKMTINRIRHREALQKLDEQERLDANIMKERYEDAMSQNRIGAGKVFTDDVVGRVLQMAIDEEVWFRALPGGEHLRIFSEVSNEDRWGDTFLYGYHPEGSAFVERILEYQELMIERCQECGLDACND